MDLYESRNSRVEICNKIAKMPKVLMARNYNFPDYEADGNHLQELAVLLDKIDNMFSLDEQTVAATLGGEFKYDDIYVPDDIELPLFMHFDLMLVAIRENMKDTVKLNPFKEQLIAQLKMLREKASKLPYSADFDSRKHLSISSISNIAASRGNYSFEKERIDGKNYIKCNTLISRENMTVQNGDSFEQRSETFPHSDYFYREDNEYFDQVKKERIRAHLLDIANHIKTYFVNGEIPSSESEFNTSLVDPNLDLNVSAYLRIVYLNLMGETKDADMSLDDAYEFLLEAEKRVVPVPKTEPVVKETVQTEVVPEETSEKKGMFTRFFGRLFNHNKAVKPADADATFEKERARQLAQDEEVRNDYIVFRSMMLEGKRKFVGPYGPRDYKVITKKGGSDNE